MSTSNYEQNGTSRLTLVIHQLETPEEIVNLDNIFITASEVRDQIIEHVIHLVCLLFSKS